MRNCSLVVPLLLLSVSSAPQPLLAASSPVIQTGFGPVQGLTDQFDTYTWQGIPYAAPPVGEMRWRAPGDPTPWTQTRQTTAFSQECLQADSGSDLGYIGGEDCLTLNVWRPVAESSTPRPVMVWIHGGGNTSGSTSFGLYYGAQLAATADVVLVTIQYRLSFLGWFQEEALHSSSALDNSGNFGNLDQIKALQWVQTNAAAFGGDPGRVTVFGESAGGMNTWALMASPQAKGLFHRAIVQSGCPYFVPMEQARQTAGSIAEILVVNDGLATAENAAAYIASQGNAWLKSYLYGKPAEEILLEVDAAGALGMMAFYGIQDGTVLPADAYATIAAGQHNRVPTIIGSNRDEMKLFFFPLYKMKKRVYDSLMEDQFGDEAAEVETLYPLISYTQPLYYNRYTDIQDGWLELICPFDGATIASPHQNVWMYHFRYDDLIEPFDEMLGAAHAGELPFLFGNFSEDLYSPDDEPQRQALSTTLMRQWGCLARTGDPSGCSGLPDWPTFSTSGADAYTRLVLDTVISTEPMSRLELERADYWNALGGVHLPDTESQGMPDVERFGKGLESTDPRRR